MKEVLMMILSDCPYCKAADRMIEKLKRENPEYEAVQIRRADEEIEEELAKSLDYYYVPSFFVDGVKLMEGVPTEEKVEAVLKAALGDVL